MAGRTIAIVAALLATSSTFAQTPAGEEADPSQGDVVEIALDRDRYERMTVPVTIAGKGPYRFFIDTGAQATVVTHQVTTDLELEPTGRATLIAMGSTREVDTIDIDQLEFADRSLSGLTSPLLDRTHIGADGILGLDSLQDMRVLIDFDEDRMSVTDAGQSASNYGYEIVVRARARLGQMIITDARLNGVKTAIIIDTGAQGSLGNKALLERLRARSRASLTFMDVHGVSTTGDLAYVRSLRIDRMEMKGVPIGFAESPAFAALGLDDEPALILGMSNLRMFDRVAIDFAARKVLFDLPREAYRPDFSSGTNLGRS